MLFDLDTLGTLSKVDPSIAAVLGVGPVLEIDWTNAAALKQAVASAEQMRNDKLGPVEHTLEESYETFTLRDGATSNLKIHRPASVGSGKGGPLILLFFGGGWISGSLEQTTQYARGLARAFHAVVVSPQYRLAPQFAFPTQAKDCFDAVKWAAEHAKRLGADPSKGFIVGGPSAGASCAAAVARMAQEEPLEYALTGQWLAIPMLFTESIVPGKYKQHFLSREQNAEAPILNQAALNAIREHVKWDGTSTLPWPTLSSEPLSELPPTFIQVCGMDPLRDDGLIYDEMLRDSGVETRISVYPGCPHGHWNTFEGLEISKRAYADIMVGFGWLLGMDITAEEGLEFLRVQGR